MLPSHGGKEPLPDTVYMTSARPKEGPGKTETHQYMAAQSRHRKKKSRLSATVP